MQNASTTYVSPPQLMPTWALHLFTFALILQTGHTLEHVIQLYQHAVLGIDILHAHGLLFAFDIEWFHFLFNTAYLAVLVALFLSMGLHKKSVRATIPRSFVVLAIIALVFETWHDSEHVVRIYQHIESGCQPCSGILGSYVDLLYLHTFYNFTITVISYYTYFSWGFFRRFIEIL